MLYGDAGWCLMSQGEELRKVRLKFSAKDKMFKSRRSSKKRLASVFQELSPDNVRETGDILYFYDAVGSRAPFISRC